MLVDFQCFQTISVQAAGANTANATMDASSKCKEAKALPNVHHSQVEMCISWFWIKTLF